MADKGSFRSPGNIEKEQGGRTSNTAVTVQPSPPYSTGGKNTSLAHDGKRTVRANPRLTLPGMNRSVRGAINARPLPASPRGDDGGFGAFRKIWEHMAYMGFDALKSKLAKRPGVTSPGGLAAAIGRRKYGADKFQRAAAAGKKMGSK